jgi:transcriptional regulator with XRE-family HTH domain
MAPNSTLKMAIWTSGKTQTDVSKAAGIHETRLSKIVRGHRAPSDDEKVAIAQALGIQVDHLFPQAVAS